MALLPWEKSQGATKKCSDQMVSLCRGIPVGHMPRNLEVVGSIPGYRHCSAPTKRTPKVCYLYRFSCKKMDDWLSKLWISIRNQHRFANTCKFDDQFFNRRMFSTTDFNEMLSGV